MLFPFLTTSLSIAVLIIHARAGPSGTPGAYVCPPKNLLGLGFPLGTYNLISDPIFCSYPVVQGENPNDFYCTYSKTTGVLVTNNGLCPSKAPLATMARKGQRRNAHAPLPTRPKNGIHGVPDLSTHKRSYLKKRRFIPRHTH